MSQRSIFYVITKGTWGGAQRYVCDLAVASHLHGDQVTVVMGTEGSELAAALATHHIPVITIPGLGRNINPISELRTLGVLWRLLRQHRPHTVHLNSSKIGGLGALAARIARIPHIIFTAHGWAFNEPRPWWQRRVIMLAHWVSLLLCHRIIAVSQPTAQQIASWPGLKHKIKIIHNGLAPIPFEDAITARQPLCRCRANLAAVWTLDRPSIGIVAELHRNKGLDIAITAMSQLVASHPQTIMIVIGEGEERSRLEQMIRDLNLVSNVFLIGQVPQAATLLKAFTIFSLPSRTEALPYAVIEAAMAGLPIVASNVGGIPEIIAHEHAGLLVPPQQPTALATAWTQLLDHPDLAAAYGRQALADSQAFSLATMVEQTRRLYQ